MTVVELEEDQHLRINLLLCKLPDHLPQLAVRLRRLKCATRVQAAARWHRLYDPQPGAECCPCPEHFSL
jgi:hypothetical protein